MFAYLTYILLFKKWLKAKRTEPKCLFNKIVWSFVGNNLYLYAFNIFYTIYNK